MNPNIIETAGTVGVGSSAVLGHNRTAMETPSINGNLPAGSVSNTWDADVLKDQLNRVLQVVNGILDALSTGGTACELTYCELEVCKLGLNTLKLSLQGTDSLLVCHKSKTAVWSNDPKLSHGHDEPPVTQNNPKI